MKLRLLFFFLSICIFYYHVQGQNINNASSNKQLLSGLRLDWNQYLQFQGDTIILFVNIVPETSLQNDDSLLTYAGYKYGHIENKAGAKNLKDKRVCIIYSGRETDKLNKYFWFKNGKFYGKEVTLEKRDTIAAPTNDIAQRFTTMPINKFVRHQKEDGKWVVEYTTILNKLNADSASTASNMDALLVLMNYLRSDYNLYKNVRMRYISQYGGFDDGIEITREMDNLILANLADYIKSKP